MTDMNILDLFLKASLLVKLIMLILIGFSIASWAIIIQRTRILNAAAREAEAFEDKFWSGIELSRLYQESQGKRDNLTGSKRREELINTIKSSTSPISGKTLAQLYDVSRQVIVQDIALLRTAGYDIISTNRGYILNAPHTITRVFKVSHTDAQTEDELYSIVDLGGTVVNVMVNHRVYGHMEAPLGISSRLKVKAFIDDIKNGKSSPLKNITSNYHYHTVEADSEKTLDLIEKTLEEKGYLITEV